MAATYCDGHSRLHENDVDCPDCALHAAQHALCEAAVKVRAAEAAFSAAVAAKKETRHIFRAKEKKRIELDAAIDAYTALRGKDGAA